MVKIFECPKRAQEVPRTWDRCRKMVFRSIFDEVKNVKKIENFGSKFSNVQKGPQRSLEHGIDVENWFLDRFSAKLRMSKIRKILVKIFECSKRAPEVPRTWDRCRKMVFRSIFDEVKNVKKIENFGSKFSNVQKGPQRSLEHGIDVEKWFLDRFSTK